jgi:rhomboid protease GluP
MGVRQLGPVVEDLYGGARMVVIYTVAGVTGFFLSSALAYYAGGLIPFFSGGPYTLGASAPIFGLLGALVYYGRRGGSSLVSSQAWSYVVSMGLFGLMMPAGIDNAAHLGGFIGGYVASLWLDPLKPERMDHFIGAAVCLLATASTILFALISHLPLLFQIIRYR